MPVNAYYRAVTTAVAARRGSGLRIRTGEVTLRGRRVALSRKEIALLSELRAHRAQAVLREDLYARVWGRPMLSRRDRSVDVYVRKLRAKLAQLDPDTAFIHTYVGFGYRFEPKREP
jgi:DNA-binding response OmpR family regulator